MTRPDGEPGVRDLVPDAWQEALVLSLRMRDVSGGQIGEAVAEVEQFCLDSRSTAQDAFGSPDDYAARLTQATGSAARPASWGQADARTALSRGAAVLGFVLVLVAAPAAVAGDATVAVTLGWLLAVPAILVASVLVVRAAVDDAVLAAEVSGPRRRRRGLWAVTAVTFLAVAALVVLLPQPVVHLPTPLALAIGVALLIADGVVGTLRELREPAADLVVDPRDSSGDPAADAARRRRTAVRSGVLTAWILPVFALVGAMTMIALDALA